ncbi:hypothetical protein PITC_059500 [Penicillium italicum]|uniref:Uncharacterized protein n=1 Tax=Penicillium italicum TaxID=40296 RepID=A0A0A2LE01_PENIT|nr:hypothetical protein PITC_059500 [Penicillium italicum]
MVLNLGLFNHYVLLVNLSKEVTSYNINIAPYFGYRSGNSNRTVE